MEENKKAIISRRAFIAGSGAVLFTALLGGCKAETLTSTVTSTKTSTLLSTITDVLTTTETVTVTETALQPATRVITDMAGNQVTVPYDIKRIVITCYGGATHEVAAMGAAAKIVAQPNMNTFPAFLKMYPEFSDIPFVGSFSDVNIEELLELNPDVVIASMTSTQMNQEIAEVGIPVISIYTSMYNVATDLENEFSMMGSLLNSTERSDELNNFWNQQLQVIEEHLQDIAVEDRKKVYYSIGPLTRTTGNTLWGQALITAAGGINVGESLEGTLNIDAEQIIEWNPDVVIIRRGSGTGLVEISDFTDNPQLQGIKAVKNNQVYGCPIGTFWWDCPAPEMILGIVWLAKTLYPEQMSDVDLEALTKSFYSQFYDYELTTEEFEAFLSQDS